MIGLITVFGGVLLGWFGVLKFGALNGSVVCPGVMGVAFIAAEGGGAALLPMLRPPVLIAGGGVPGGR